MKEFCFQLTKEEYHTLIAKSLMSQNETSKKDNRGGRTNNALCFYRTRIAMLASVLRTNIASKISVKIMDVFVEMRKFLTDV